MGRWSNDGLQLDLRRRELEVHLENRVHSLPLLRTQSVVIVDGPHQRTPVGTSGKEDGLAHLAERMNQVCGLSLLIISPDFATQLAENRSPLVQATLL